jgi:hypothetical protein
MRRYLGKADFNQPTILADSVENDPLQTSTCKMLRLHPSAFTVA